MNNWENETCGSCGFRKEPFCCLGPEPVYVQINTEPITYKPACGQHEPIETDGRE